MPRQSLMSSYLLLYLNDLIISNKELFESVLLEFYTKQNCFFYVISKIEIINWLKLFIIITAFYFIPNKILFT